MNQEEHDALAKKPEEEVRTILEKKYGEVWDTEEVRERFNVIWFKSPHTLVERKADKVKGTLKFVHHPRFYFGFQKGW